MEEEPINLFQTLAPYHWFSIFEKEKTTTLKKVTYCFFFQKKTLILETLIKVLSLNTPFSYLCKIFVIDNQKSH